MIFEKAYAKINLALEVGQVVNGYHEVSNIMVPISLYDDLFFEKYSIDYVECEDDIEDNLCLKAIKIFKDKFNITEGVHIILKKHIPIMAGLAGGSSDAAATLRGLNRLFDVHASDEELYELACMLGSDVPFFLKSKASLCTGRGEIVKPLGFELPRLSLVLVKPSFGLSTKEIYSKYVFDGINRRVDIENIILGLKNNDLDLLESFIFNDLEKIALNSKSELKVLFEKIEKLSYCPHVSGSGPTIYILDAKAKDLENIKAITTDEQLFICHLL